MPKKKVVVLGATGSIGSSSLNIIKNFQNKFELVGFSIHKNINKAKSISHEFSNTKFCITSSQNFTSKYDINIKAISNLLEEVNPDIVVNGIASSAGLKASIAVLELGIDLALANKETIVNAGELIQDLAKKKQAKIIPVDSEHAAIFNLINAHKKNNISKIIITASGGTFRNLPKEQLTNIRVEDALKHPTWKMGGKITIDSASLANKALEVIEAVKLFNISANNIIVSVHPQSIVHSLVQLKNGEIYAQLSPPDMRHPIFNALTYPNLPEEYLKPLDFSKAFNLEFMPPRIKDFPMLNLGFLAAQKLRAYTLAFNCANEEAVDAFFDKKIKFTDIPIVVEKVLQFDWSAKLSSFKDVYQAEKKARQNAQSEIKNIDYNK